QAQRDLTTKVKHDSATNIGHDCTLQVKHALSVEVAEGTHATTVSKGAMSANVPNNAYRLKAKEIVLEANGFKIQLDMTGITLKAGGSEVLLTPALLNLNGAIIKLNS